MPAMPLLVDRLLQEFGERCPIQGTGSGNRSRCRTDLLDALTSVKDMRSHLTNQITKGRRTGARVATVRNTCIPNELTKRPPPEAF